MGVGIQDTRGLITGEVYEGTITSACKDGSLASIVVLTRSLKPVVFRVVKISNFSSSIKRRVLSRGVPGGADVTGGMG